ncbi:SHD1 domain-containing protein [Mariniblastus fucicola]|uniref:SLA1 homology domain-containing protein n=1 Tax=Mariniblastus fucicola TaxID=980251 RepID=A0A5B9PFT7_9BACT|nr:SHD1 domain-containing protein [Mariniblastus fucicola]QEG25184.1 hypothetical protein MFFC18_51080 [Mariniblastus fucicola]
MKLNKQHGAALRNDWFELIFFENLKVRSSFSKSARLALGFCLAIHFLFACDLQGQEFKTWTDRTGKFSVEAKFLAAENGKVVLLDRTGKRITVAIDRLSATDRTEIEKLQGDPFELQDSPSVEAVRSVTCVIWSEFEGKSHASAGMVFFKDEEFAFASFEAERGRRYSGSCKVVLIDESGNEKRVDGEMWEAEGPTQSVTVKFDSRHVTNTLLDLPIAECEQGMNVQIVGTEIARGQNSDSVAPMTFEGKITKIFRGRDNSIERVQMDSKDFKIDRLALVINANGAFVGIPGNLPRGSTTRELFPASMIPSLIPPHVSSPKARLLKQDDAFETFEIEGLWYDSWQAEAKELLVYRYDHTEREVSESLLQGQSGLRLETKKGKYPASFVGKIKIPTNGSNVKRLVIRSKRTIGGKEFFSKPVTIKMPRKLAGTDAKNTGRKPVRPKNRGRSTRIPVIKKSSLVPLTDTERTELEANKAWVKTEAPKPAAEKKSAIAKDTDLGGLAAKEINAAISCDPIWSKGGTELYYSDTSGKLIRTEYPSFEQTHVLPTGTKPVSIALANNCALTLSEKGQVLIVDSSDLKVKHRLVAKGATQLAAAPTSRYAYAGGDNGIQVIDTMAGRVVSMLEFPVLDVAATSDGKYLLTSSKPGQIGRFAIEDEHLTFEETSQPHGGNRPLCLCADDKHVALPGGSASRGTLLFSIDNLQTPKLKLEEGVRGRTLDIDPASKRILLCTNDFSLIVLDSKGVRNAKFKASDYKYQVKSYVAHPSDGSLLILGGDVFNQSQAQLLGVRLAGKPEDWKVGDSNGLPTISFSTLDPVDVDEPMMGDEVGIDGPAKAFELKLDRSKFGEALPIFSPKGDRLYLLDRDGVLSMYSVPEFRKLKTLNTGQGYGRAFTMTRSGLLVGCRANDCVYLVDNESLKIKKRFFTSCNLVLAGSPKSKYAIGTGTTPNRKKEICVFDVNRGKVIFSETQREFLERQKEKFPENENFPLSEVMTMSPDGKHLFVSAGSLARYRVTRDGLMFEEVSQAFCEFSQPVFGGKLVATPGGNRCPFNSDWPIINESHYVFAMDNLQKPKFVVDSGEEASTMTFHPKRPLIYAQNDQHPLIIFRTDGTRVDSCTFHNERKSDIFRFFVSPSGKGILALSHDWTYWFELK